MCVVCGDSRHLTANKRRRQIDPTHTITLRRKFEAELYKRFMALKGAIIREIVDNDGFGLRTNGVRVNRGRFEFTRSADKVQAFNVWLREMVDAGILETSQGAAIGTAGNAAWTDVYVESAYQRGLAHSAAQLRAAGAVIQSSWVENAFWRPMHADRAGLIFTRTFTELEGITDAMAQQISRTLAQGISEGRSPLEIARSLNDRVEHIGITRARTLARTEVIAAHADASLNAYEEAGVQGVTLMAEISTANDARVCDVCQTAAERGVYTLEEARGLIPLHPNCRCAIIPVVLDAQGLRFA